MKVPVLLRALLVTLFTLTTVTGTAAAQTDSSEPPPPSISSADITACDRVIERAWVTNEADAEVARIYMAYFLRNPDADGLDYWRSVYSEQGLGVISWSFALSTEFEMRYGSLDTYEFLSLMYNNIMCREPDESGFWYWYDLIEAGEVDRSSAFLLFSQSDEFKIRTRTA